MEYKELGHGGIRVPGMAMGSTRGATHAADPRSLHRYPYGARI